MSRKETVAPEEAPPTEGTNRPRRRLSWTWLAGADDRVLALVPSERSFLEAQGMVIFAMACVTGFAVAVAASGWWDVPVTHVLWLGLAWTAVICIIDRLIYKSFGTGRLTNLALAVPRAALSVMLALVLGLPMVQFIFRPSIYNQLSLDRRAAEASQDSGDRVLRTEDQAANAQIAAIEDNETTLENRVSKFTRLSGCEGDEPSCSHTHLPGCGHWCRYYARQATSARATLSTARGLKTARRSPASGGTSPLEADEANEIQNPCPRSSRRPGSPCAGAGAVDDPEAAPGGHEYILFVLGLFVCLDLVALVMKVSHLLITGAAYEEVAAALRERDRLEAHRLTEETAVLEAVHQGGAGRKGTSTRYG